MDSGATPEIVPPAGCACRGASPSPLHRCAEVLRWAVPGGILALMPKCPACVAGHIALFTGLGVSLSAAAYLRGFLLFLCVVFLTWALIRLGRRLLH